MGVGWPELTGSACLECFNALTAHRAAECVRDVITPELYRLINS